MNKVDTSAEAVERDVTLLRSMAEKDCYPGRPILSVLAASYEMVAAERANARDEVAGWAGVAAGKDDVIRRLETVLSNLLSVTPAFPAAARQIVGMEDRYNKAIKEAKEVLGL